MDKRGDDHFSVTAEFGPQLYQHCMPYTRKDLADNWEINNYIGIRVETMFLNGTWNKGDGFKEAENKNTERSHNGQKGDLYIIESKEQTKGSRCPGTKSDHRVFSDAEKEQYEQDGFIFRRGFLSKEEVAKLKNTMINDKTINGTKHYTKDDSTGKKVDLSLINTPGVNAYGAVARSARMVDNVEKLLGDECYHYHQKMIRKEPKRGGSFEWHQDYGYWYDNGILTPNLTTCFVALDKCEKANGCLQVLKGSQKMGRITHVTTGEQAGADMERMEEALKSPEFEVVFCEMEAGDAIFFHSNTLHTSGPNISQNTR